MNTKTISRLGALGLVATIAVLAGCAAPANREAMSPPNVTVAKKFPYTVFVETRGGSETGAMESSNISNEDLKAAIESAIVKSALFRSVIQGKTADYELAVTVAQVSKPILGASFTVTMEAGWSLTMASDKSVVMRKVIASSHTAAWNEAFAGTTRLRLALEGAARENISQGLQAIAQLDLK